MCYTYIFLLSVSMLAHVLYHSLSRVVVPATLHNISVNVPFQINSLLKMIWDCFKLFNFPIGSYVETMSADGGDLGRRSWSQDIILKVDYLRTIHARFTLNWLTGFRGSYVKTKSSHDGHLEYPLKVSQFTANIAWMILKWSTFKIMSSDPDLHPRWPPSADIVLT
jgi:hypothetical protein